MQRLICVLTALMTPLLLWGDDGVGKELKTLEGKWKTVAMEAGGKELPKEMIQDFTLIVGADGKTTGKNTQGEFQFTMSVNPSKSPKTIENLHESGQSKGKKQYGVYKLEGDKFTVCMTPRGAAESTRPKDFETKGTTNVVFFFERVKEGK